MKITKKLRKAKGFTLVELLIVIIIIGILAGMMMLATGAATDKAEATKIVSNMRNIKAAAIMFYADKNRWPESTSDDNVMNAKLDQSLLASGAYSIPAPVSDDYIVRVEVADSNIRAKLLEMASTSAISVDTNGATMPIN